MPPAPIAIPQAIMDAVAEAEAQAATPTEDVPAEQAAQVEPVIGDADAQGRPEPEVPAEPEVEVDTAEPEVAEPEAAEAESSEAPGANEEVSLEAILEDLKRREGRND